MYFNVYACFFPYSFHQIFLTWESQRNIYFYFERSLYFYWSIEFYFRYNKLIRLSIFYFLNNIISNINVFSWNNCNLYAFNLLHLKKFEQFLWKKCLYTLLNSKFHKIRMSNNLIPRICYENVINVALLTKRIAIHKMFHNIFHDCPPFTTINRCFYVGFVIDFAQYLRDASKWSLCIVLLSCPLSSSFF